MKILFREHKGLLTDAMETLKEFDSLLELYRHVLELSKDYRKPTERIYIKLYSGYNKPLGEDDRIGWKNTFIIGLEEYDRTPGWVIGFMCIQ